MKTTLKALIVDDESVVRDSLKAILEKSNGYVTDFAADGEEAIDKIKNNFYDFILLDLVLPKIDGYEVLKLARALYPGLPVIFVSGRAQAKKVRESIARHQLNGFIEKPFTPESVIDEINKALTTKTKLA